MIWGIIILIGFILTISISRLSSPQVHPNEEEEEHLFAERPIVPDENPNADLKIDQKQIVINELMVNGTITFERAKELGVKRLAGVIYRLRKLHRIDNVIVDGKFSHYKLIEFRGK